MENLKELDLQEMQEYEGGVVAAVATALGILGGVCLLAYGAGYLYGKLTC